MQSILILILHESFVFFSVSFLCLFLLAVPYKSSNSSSNHHQASRNNDNDEAGTIGVTSWDSWAWTSWTHRTATVTWILINKVLTFLASTLAIFNVHERCAKTRTSAVSVVDGLERWSAGAYFAAQDRVGGTRAGADCEKVGGVSDDGKVSLCGIGHSYDLLGGVKAERVFRVVGAVIYLDGLWGWSVSVFAGDVVGGNDGLLGCSEHLIWRNAINKGFL